MADEREASAHDELRARNAELEAIFRALPDLLFEISPDGRIVRYRAGRTEDLYTTPDDFLGRRMDDVLPAEPGAQLKEALARVLAGEPLVRIEYDLAVPGGLKRFEARVVPTDGGHAIVVARDITEQRRAEEERRELDRKMQEAQRLESIGVLAGGIAHDFNNLMTAIIGGAELLGRHAPDDTQIRAPLRIVEEAAWRAAELSRQLLAYAGKGRFEMETVDVGALVRDTARLLETVVAKGVRLDLDLDSAAPPVHVDLAQVRQVVMNLVTNASDAYRGRPGVISIRTRLVDGSGTSVEAGAGDGTRRTELVVEDTGAGMDATTRDRMFDPFFTTKGLGRGLGLASVLGIVRAHRGTIDVDSEPGRGTRVCVRLPAVDGATVPGAEIVPGATLSFDRRTVLVVDDEPGVREVTARILAEAGLDVITAADGHAAVDAFARHGSIDLVVVDMTMPGLAGDETFLALRRIDAAVPVVLTSAYDERDARERLTGVEPRPFFLQKPVRTRALLTTIATAIGVRSKRSDRGSR